MASDVENLSTYYANLPSIFETYPSTSIQLSSDTTTTLSDNEKTYQPMFGSFLFTDSEPFTKAAFVDSTTSSIEVKSTEEDQLDETSIVKEHNVQTKDTSPLAPVEDISDIDDDNDDDDEDDFDGIPIRHASTMIKDVLNGDNHSEHNNNNNNSLLDEFIDHIENDGDEEELFLNGFIDEQPEDKTTILSLFNNIPDIDDLNEHEEDDDDDRIPFDHMDMLDQSDSIRSSSPDSVLSSSHLRDDDYDEDDDEEMNNHDNEDDVTQWNDDYLLEKISLQNNRPNAPLPPPIVLNIHPHDQVDFIDSSRSNSRCSNASSHLSNGYTDQARIFLNDDDELVTSSDSENDDYDNADKIDFENDLLTRDNSEEPSLQVNLDYHPSRSSSFSDDNDDNNSTHSSSSSPSPILVPDQSPIIAIDEEINETKNSIQSAPIAIVDDDDDDEDDVDDDNNLPFFTSSQPVLAPIPIKNFIELRNEYRQNEIVHDIINMRYLLTEHDNDDEFLAIMHNPTVFEEVLYDNDDQQELDLAKQTNIVTNTFQTSSQLSIENESSQYCQNIQEKLLFSSSVSNNEKNSPSNIITTNNSSPTAVNHLLIEKNREEEEDEENVDAVNRSRIKLKKTQQLEDKNITNINKEQIANCEKEQQDHYQMMNSDNESDNDSELLETLAQLHGLVHTSEMKTNHLISNSNVDEKQHMIFFNNDDKKTYEKKEGNFFSLTSLTSSILFNDDESHSADIILDSDASSSLITSNYDLNTSMLSSKHYESSISSSFDIEVIPIVEKLVSNTLQLAFDQINESHRQIEQFVERILSDAIYEIYHEDENFSTENLALIINWHNNQINKQSLDPFDQQFHHQWINHFQTPDDELNLFSTTSNQSNSSLLINPFDTTIMDNNLMKYPLTASVKNISTDDKSGFYDNFISFMNESTITPDEQSKDFPSTENQDNIQTSTIIDRDENQLEKHENFYENQPPLSQFDAFASDRPLNTAGFDSIAAEIDNQFNQELSLQRTNSNDNEPWELEDNSEEKLKPIPTSLTQNDSYTNYFPDTDMSVPERAPSPSSTEDSSDEENHQQIEKEDYNDYFTNHQSNENMEFPLSSKTVRFSDKLHNITDITPKDSFHQSQSSVTTSDTDEIDEKETISDLPTISNHINENELNHNNTFENSMRNIVPRPDSIISLTESEDLPPPLPPLPPLNNKPTTANNNIPSKSSASSNTDLKSKITSRTQSEHTPAIQPTTTNWKLSHNTDSQVPRSINDSAFLHSISKDDTNVDPDEVNGVISCMIDNNPINIDAKTISPFKCVIGSAGPLEEDNQTAVITIYGCWLPDHRLREYRYIMDQLFYYVYHKLEKLVTNDYILVYFHGATPKHRTPDLKFLRKCYQMINFRLRKNLRAVYVVHPTRWLRTVIALSRPFFSNKFYHKVNYLFTLSELEQRFPRNNIEIPIIIEQTDWLYSQKYDRHNASIKRSIERSTTHLTSGTGDESAA